MGVLGARARSSKLILFFPAILHVLRLVTSTIFLVVCFTYRLETFPERSRFQAEVLVFIIEGTGKMMSNQKSTIFKETRISVVLKCLSKWHKHGVTYTIQVPVQGHRRNQILTGVTVGCPFWIYYKYCFPNLTFGEDMSRCTRHNHM